MRASILQKEELDRAHRLQREVGVRGGSRTYEDQLEVLGISIILVDFISKMKGE